MKVLALDTTAKSASVAIAENNKLIASFYINTGLTHSQTLIPMIDNVLQNSSISLSEIDAIAVNVGPGSFTGVRIGVAAAKGLAFANNTKCISVSTLESMAYNMADLNCVVCCVMDARCNQVYNALFKCNNGKVDRLCNDRALSILELYDEIKTLNEPVYLIGDGAEICFKEFNDNNNIRLAPQNLLMQNASSTARIADIKYQDGNTITAEQLMPTYLRLPQAERELNKKLGVKK